jgi:hypothetical protein
MTAFCCARLSGPACLRFHRSATAKKKNGWRFHHPLKVRASDLLPNYGVAHAIGVKKSKLDLTVDNFRHVADSVNVCALAPALTGFLSVRREASVRVTTL